MSQNELKACEACKSSKRKCTKQLPKCRRCELRGLNCLYESQPSMVIYEAIHGTGTLSRVRQAHDTHQSLGDVLPPAIDAMTVDPQLELQLSSPSISPTFLSLDDLRSAWFLTPDAWKNTPVEILNLAPLSTTTIQGHFSRTMDWLREWIRTGSNPFIHPKLYSKSMPTCVHDAFMSLSTYLLKTDKTSDMVHRLIENKADKLVASQTNGDHGRDTLEDIGRVQSLLIYCTIRLLDGDIRQRHLAEQHLPILHDWTKEMLQNAVHATMDDTLLFCNALTNCTPRFNTEPAIPCQVSSEQLLWHAWILSESVRRTWCMSMGIQASYDLLKTGTGPCYGGLLVTTRKGVWDAETAFAWTKLCAERSVGFVHRNETERLMSETKADEVDSKMARRWILTSQEGFETSLKYEENIPVPSTDKLGPNEVLVKMRAASLNYRDIVIAGPGGINGPITAPVVPACDGAGSVEAVGTLVTNFKPGDRVITYAAPKAVESKGGDAYSSMADVQPMLGQGTDGTLQSIGVFAESALVHAPTSLEWLPAATLTVTWLTAWNVLFGLEGKKAGPGTFVLVQGTGGVSIATLQVAVAFGATVVATTSSEAKAARLRALGAQHVVNYQVNPDGWGIEARYLTPDGRGFDTVVDIGGNETLSQSLSAVRVDGVIAIVGGVGKDTEPVPLFAALMHTCIVRGSLGGSHNQLKELVRFIDETKVRPAVDDVVFELADVKGAYRRLEDKKHFAKVLIRVDHPEGA
ncbi:hypothetical protein B0J13DRAFT_499735 [Dactylonectria estremocensis]|uniref:Zn(2)-C6 fungal-type domain-containing protein n=1 Tax=Dactylonectria estremocensis TaxID=1079267 RepID=A0A9P9D6X6_9HYPO|nr:hypothetical protein B0J13DRAFT_516541 [Dactylonectria estremocensis]KAH7113709.1 hypothetical protein B0J13DRAFT_515437 [Dactylonectria estremocensis]KAH7150576.1 hypothetical protein B0J13DRAFT_499735 [Dactylonectria estremocensis]